MKPSVAVTAAAARGNKRRNDAAHFFSSVTSPLSRLDSARTLASDAKSQKTPGSSSYFQTCAKRLLRISLLFVVMALLREANIVHAPMLAVEGMIPVLYAAMTATYPEGGSEGGSETIAAAPGGGRHAGGSSLSHTSGHHDLRSRVAFVEQMLIAMTLYLFLPEDALQLVATYMMAYCLIHWCLGRTYVSAVLALVCHTLFTAVPLASILFSQLGFLRRDDVPGQRSAIELIAVAPAKWFVAYCASFSVQHLMFVNPQVTLPSLRYQFLAAVVDNVVAQLHAVHEYVSREGSLLLRLPWAVLHYLGSHFLVPHCVMGLAVWYGFFFLDWTASLSLGGVLFTASLVAGPAGSAGSGNPGRLKMYLLFLLSVLLADTAVYALASPKVVHIVANGIISAHFVIFIASHTGRADTDLPMVAMGLLWTGMLVTDFVVQMHPFSSIDSVLRSEPLHQTRYWLSINTAGFGMLLLVSTFIESSRAVGFVQDELRVLTFLAQPPSTSPGSSVAAADKEDFDAKAPDPATTMSTLAVETGDGSSSAELPRAQTLDTSEAERKEVVAATATEATLAVALGDDAQTAMSKIHVKHEGNSSIASDNTSVANSQPSRAATPTAPAGGSGSVAPPATKKESKKKHAAEESLHFDNSSGTVLSATASGAKASSFSSALEEKVLSKKEKQKREQEIAAAAAVAAAAAELERKRKSAAGSQLGAPVATITTASAVASVDAVPAGVSTPDRESGPAGATGAKMKPSSSAPSLAPTAMQAAPPGAPKKTESSKTILQKSNTPVNGSGTTTPISANNSLTGEAVALPKQPVPSSAISAAKSSPVGLGTSAGAPTSISLPSPPTPAAAPPASAKPTFGDVVRGASQKSSTAPPVPSAAPTPMSPLLATPSGGSTTAPPHSVDSTTAAVPLPRRLQSAAELSPAPPPPSTTAVAAASALPSPAAASPPSAAPTAATASPNRQKGVASVDGNADSPALLIPRPKSVQMRAAAAREAAELAASRLSAPATAGSSVPFTIKASRGIMSIDGDTPLEEEPHSLHHDRAAHPGTAALSSDDAAVVTGPGVGAVVGSKHQPISPKRSFTDRNASRVLLQLLEGLGDGEAHRHSQHDRFDAFGGLQFSQSPRSGADEGGSSDGKDDAGEREVNGERVDVLGLARNSRHGDDASAGIDLAQFHLALTGVQFGASVVAEGEGRSAMGTHQVPTTSSAAASLDATAKLDDMIIQLSSGTSPLPGSEVPPFPAPHPKIGGGGHFVTLSELTKAVALVDSVGVSSGNFSGSSEEKAATPLLQQHHSHPLHHSLPHTQSQQHHLSQPAQTHAPSPTPPADFDSLLTQGFLHMLDEDSANSSTSAHTSLPALPTQPTGFLVQSVNASHAETHRTSPPATASQDSYLRVAHGPSAAQPLSAAVFGAAAVGLAPHQSSVSPGFGGSMNAMSAMANAYSAVAAPASYPPATAASASQPQSHQSATISQVVMTNQGPYALVALANGQQIMCPVLYQQPGVPPAIAAVSSSLASVTAAQAAPAVVPGSTNPSHTNGYFARPGATFSAASPSKR